jgi:hypothetical protein
MNELTLKIIQQLPYHLCLYGRIAAVFCSIDFTIGYKMRDERKNLSTRKNFRVSGNSPNCGGDFITCFVKKTDELRTETLDSGLQ